MNRKVVCLCGSTRFKQEFEQANAELSLSGHIVLTVCWFTHVQGSYKQGAEEVYAALHYDKIDMADEIYVVNPLCKCCKKCGKIVEVVSDKLARCHACSEIFPPSHTDVKGYVGEATAKEIAYAKKSGKPVKSLNPLE